MCSSDLKTSAVLPFYLALGLDLRSLRLFRLARLAILLKIFRFSKAARRFQLAFKLVPDVMSKQAHVNPALWSRSLTFKR